MDASWKAQSTENKDGNKYTLAYSPEAIAYTDEPKAFQEYTRQIDRWFSIGGVIKKNVRNVRRGVKAMLAWAFLEATFPFLFAAMLLYFAVTQRYADIAFALALDMLSLLAISVYLGYKYDRSLRTIVRGAAWFWLYRFVNAYKFWQRIAKPKKKWY